VFHNIMNTTNREQPHSQHEKSSQNIQPKRSGIRGQLLQFAQPMHTDRIHDDKRLFAYPVITLPLKAVKTKHTEQSAGSLNAVSTSTITQSPVQVPSNLHMGPEAQTLQAIPFNPGETGSAQEEKPVKGDLGAIPPPPHTDAAPPPAPAQPAPMPRVNPSEIDEKVLDALFTDPENAFFNLLSRPLRALAALVTSRHSVPVLTQMAVTECGIGRDGLSANSIAKSARRYGMQARVLTMEDTDDFKEIDLPAIIHWEFKHFMVVERWTPNYAYVVDPAIGRKKLTREEFDKGFTGVVVQLGPGEHFVQREKKSNNALLANYLQNGLKRAPSTVLQMLFASLILLLFGLIMPATTAIVINSIVPLSLVDMLPLFGLGMVMAILTNAILTYLRSVITLKLGARINADLMISLFDHLLSLPLRYFLLCSSGDTLSRIASSAILRDTLNTQLIATVLDAVTIVVYMFILFAFAPPFALVTLIFGLAQAILIVGSHKHSLTLLRGSLEARGKSQSYIAEVLIQVTTLKAAGAEKYARSRWLRLFLEEISADVCRGSFASLTSSLGGFVRSLAPLTLILIGAQQVIVGSMQLGTMMALLALASSFLRPFESLANTVYQIQQAQANLERIADVMKAEPELHGNALIQPPRLKGHIQLINVGFQYDLSAKPVLQSINLTIQPGQKVALVGRSGSGKSTLGKLLLGLYLPTRGEIYYDGNPLTSMKLQDVRAQFGVVMQDIGLFNGSIRENIAFNTPGADLRAVIRAAQIAAIHEDILKMPMDYETIVSEGGNAISGGQRQRIALARALVRDPSILLLDEATSSLDVATEQVIEENLKQLSCTQIVIAHRLSTIRNADIILVVDKGTIVEQGTHEELFKRNGFYAHLIKSQMVSGDLK
jgi:ATP-binding cassette subfamily B protein